MRQKEVSLKRLIAAAAAIHALSCGSSPEEPEFVSLDVSVSVRSMSALGVEAGYCCGILSDGFGCAGFEVLLDGDVTDTLVGGFELGSPALSVFLRESEQGPDLASGWAGLDMQGLEVLPLGLRARYHRNPGEFDIEVEAGNQGIPDRPDSILFVGNSYTFANGGLDSIFTEFCSSADPEWDVTAGMYAVGGYTLEDHYGDPSCLDMIARGWDLVILQEQSTRPIENPALMWEYASLLADAIEEAGARPGFFMTWAREYDPSMTGPLDCAYSHAGALTDGMVSPVGLAWAGVRRAAPGLDLYEADGSHPSQAGTYLTVCTMYAAVTGQSPVGVGYCCDPSLSPEEKLVLQEEALEAVLEYGQSDWRHF